MFEKVESKTDFIKLEERILQFWKDKKIFEKTLKKTEGKPDVVKPALPSQQLLLEGKRPKIPRKIIYIICVLIFLGALALFVDQPSDEKAPVDRALIPHRAKQVQKKKTPTSVEPLVEPKETPTVSFKDLPKLYLNGIFLIEGEYLALMNEEMVKVGDVVQGVAIKKIDAGGVEVEFKNTPFRLNYP